MNNDLFCEIVKIEHVIYVSKFLGYGRFSGYFCSVGYPSNQIDIICTIFEE